MNVQAIINNINFPNDLNELHDYVYSSDLFDIDYLLNEARRKKGFVEWTVPKWILINDIVLFFHAKTAISKITHLETLLKNENERPDNEQLMNGLQHARRLYKKYGGKIFAIGRVSGSPFYDSRDWDKNERSKNWKIFARIEDLYILESPIPISDFSNFIRVSRQSSITSVFGEDFTKLKSIIMKRNTVPKYFKESEAVPIPLNKIDKDNWLPLTQQYRRQFFLEEQFRAFYVDYFLKSLGDTQTIYTECHCYKNGIATGYADNGVKLNKKVCFVEVKLNFGTERDLKGQLNKYCFVEKAQIGKNKWLYADDIVQNHVLVIDTIQLGIFDAERKTIHILAKLGDIKSNKDIQTLKQRVISECRRIGCR